MTPSAQFTAEEWSILTEAPVLAGARVVAAEAGGTLREGFAIKRVYDAARELRGESALLDQLVASTPSIDLDKMQAGAAGNERLRAALSVLAQKASAEDVDAYTGFVLAVVQTVAEANREGGFIGLGGEEVSAREQAALDEIYTLVGQ
jgi:hypothetical protein